jgi:hypothetical protein
MKSQSNSSRVTKQWASAKHEQQREPYSRILKTWCRLIAPQRNLQQHAAVEKTGIEPPSKNAARLPNSHRTAQAEISNTVWFSFRAKVNRPKTNSELGTEKPVSSIAALR